MLQCALGIKFYVNFCFTRWKKKYKKNNHNWNENYDDHRNRQKVNAPHQQLNVNSEQYILSSMSVSSVYVCNMFSSFRSIYLLILTLFSTFAFDFNVFIGLWKHNGIYLQYPLESDARYCTILKTRLRTYSI